MQVRKKKLSSILASFQKTIKELEVFKEQTNARVGDIQDAQAELLEESAELEYELEQASKVVENLKSLTGTTD